MITVRGSALAILPALAILAAPMEATARQSVTIRERMSPGDWRLTIESDRFSGAQRCWLTAEQGRVAYARGVIAIRLSGRVDPSEAVIRVDGGSPIRWRDLMPELAALDPGFASDRHSRALSIPAALLKGAQSVAISPAFGKRPRAFRIDGFEAAMERATARGCRPDAFLSRQ